MSATRALADDALRRAFAEADEGPVFDARLTPLVHPRSVRVGYHGRGNATLACDSIVPRGELWTVSKLDEDSVSLRPTRAVPTAPKIVYAGVHAALGAQVMVRVEGRWITEVGPDEVIGFEPQELLVAAFRGTNGHLFAPDPEPIHQPEAILYLIRSDGTELNARTRWFLGIDTLHQEHLELPLARELNDEDLVSVLAGHGLPDDAAGVAAFRRALGSADPPPD